MGSYQTAEIKVIFFIVFFLIFKLSTKMLKCLKNISNLEKVKSFNIWQIFCKVVNFIALGFSNFSKLTYIFCWNLSPHQLSVVLCNGDREEPWQANSYWAGKWMLSSPQLSLKNVTSQAFQKLVYKANKKQNLRHIVFEHVTTLKKYQFLDSCTKHSTIGLQNTSVHCTSA